MKELSIEEKAKAYDEALEKAKELKEYSTNTEVVGYMDELFPELKESEDEKIRREILEHCKNQAESYIQLGCKCAKIQSWIDWLEKQGEQKSAWSEEDERNLQGIIDEIKANKNAAPDYDLATYDRFLSWLESLKDRFPLMNRSLKSDNNAKPNFNVSNLAKTKLNTYED